MNSSHGGAALNDNTKILSDLASTLLCALLQDLVLSIQSSLSEDEAKEGETGACADISDTVRENSNHWVSCTEVMKGLTIRRFVCELQEASRPGPLKAGPGEWQSQRRA